MKVSLDSVEWKEFKISGIFENYHGKRLIEKQRLKGDIPFLTAGENNNGISSFIGNNILTHENFISVDMFGNSFYHSYRASGDDNIYFFINKNLSKYIKLFIVCCINKQKTKYSYGKQFRQTNADTCKILLPIDFKGDPHWQFMEDYMRAIEKEHLEKITAYYNAKLNESNRRSGGFDLVEYKNFIQNQKQLENVKWKEFTIGEIFEIKATLSGIDKNKLNGKKGNYPYITRSDKTNGIDDFIDKQNGYKSNEANVITIGLDTQTAFYQNSIFYTGQNIQILKNDQLNKYNAFFIIVELKKFMEKFNWGGNGATLARLKRGKILLPIDPKGNLNWQFMESYIKDLELKKLKNIKDYYQKKLYKYKNIS